MSDKPVRILVVDDDPQIRRFLRVSLGAHGYQVIEATSGEDGVTKAATERPDLLILDLGLPGVGGPQVIERVREWSDVPIIILSVRDQEADKVAALDSGADDYVTKPFGMDELLARIRTALRHRLQSETPTPIFRTGGLVVDLGRRIVTVDGKEVRLAPREYDLLRVLVVHAGRVLTHRQILRQVLGPGAGEETHWLRVYVGQLRRKIEENSAQPRYIRTEPGVGYRLRAPDA
jgi:two-component system KDP operon response regulator KdpE